MKKLLVIGLLFALSACTNLQNALSTVEGTSVSPSAVYVAVNAFDAVEATATNYLRLPRCSGSASYACRDPGATRRIIPAVRSGRVARTNLEQFYKDNPGALGPVGLYNALVTATNTLQSVVTRYNVGASQ